ncbi:MAG: amidohydrolase [Fidelibacterota bacterium]|nr:MAG: amidohydrolase [Candidatus Neomarinimicrobiota bacterium]
MRIKSLRSRTIMVIWILLMASAFSPALGQTTAALKQEVVRVTDELTDQIDQMSMILWDYSEIALLEERSAQYLADQLEQAGFTVTSGVAGMPTAFVATYGKGSPVIGILAEYDALPGVGNAPVPRKEARDDGVTTGQGCGHNLFGAACVGAALALKTVMDHHDLKGTIKLFGTPAEETGVGKVYMARDGVFDDLDAVLEWHPSDSTKVRNQPGRALNNFMVEFFGQSAHAAGDPWSGRSALDAVEMMNYGANLMREHVQETARIHYVVPNGGNAPNVVPDYAKVWYFVRDKDRASVEHNYNWLQKIAEGAALATETTYKVTFITGLHEYLLNRPLQEALQANLEWVGSPEFSREDQQFARDLQAALRIEQQGFHTEVIPLPDNPGKVSGGSTDVAEVSWIAPTAGFNVTTAAAEIPWHSWAATACHGTAAGRKGAIVAAKVIAATGVDLLTNRKLPKNAQAFFKKASGGRSYQSPVPEGQKVPLPGPE